MSNRQPVDLARKFIADAMATLAVLFPDERTKEFKVGATAFFENDSPPIIKFRFGSITHEDAVLADSIGTEVQEIVVRIWSQGRDDDEADSNTRVTKNRLLLACRKVSANSFPAPMEFGDFDWSPEALTGHGRWLEGSIFVRLPVPAERFSTVTIERVQVAQHADYAHTEDEPAVSEALGTVTRPPS